jgi:hypothetical protein
MFHPAGFLHSGEYGTRPRMAAAVKYKLIESLVSPGTSGKDSASSGDRCLELHHNSTPTSAFIRPLRRDDKN